MPTILGPKYLTTWEGRPQEMSQEDYLIWKQYRPKLFAEAIGLYFDVGLGGQTEAPPGTEPNMARMWLRATQKRIDVLIESIDYWVITEIRNAATAEAFGRLIMYQNMWREDPPDNKPILLRCVTNRYDKDTAETAKVLNIDYVVI